MELFRVLSELWRRRILVSLAVVLSVGAAIIATYDVSIRPFSIESKSFSIGTAQTRFLVDSTQQPLTNTELSIEPLISRAQIYARLMSSEPVLLAIAKEAGIPPTRITGTGPVAGDDQERDGEQTGSSRTQQLLEENRLYAISFVAAGGQPVVTVTVQGPDAEGSARLANAAVVGFREYLTRQQNRAPEGAGERVVIRELGTARGGIVRGEGSKPATAVLAFLLTFGVLCFLIVFLSGAWSQWRQSQRGSVAPHGEGPADPAPAGPADGDVDGDGHGAADTSQTLTRT